MDRRRSERTRYRLSAEIVHEGSRHQGFLIDVSERGAFIQTTRTLPVGSEVELWFADEQLAPQVARARVKRRRNVPAAALAALRGGIGVEWIEPPAFVRELAGGLAIDVVIDEPDACGELASAGGAAEPASEFADCASAREADGAARDEASDAPEAPASEGAYPAELSPDSASADQPAGEPPGASEAGEIVPLAEPPLIERTLEIGPAVVSAEVALIDEGELGDIEALLRALGARTLRMRWGAQAEPMLWEAPPQLVVVSARVALAVPLSDAVLGAGALGIAVCDSAASTLRAQLHRQGYTLVVQRSAHPETLRLLFASRLTRPRERRKQRRRAFGGAATFWRGLQRTRCTLLELSPSGASLLLARGLPRGAKLTVRVAARHAGGRTLALPCEVLRATETAHGAVIGLRFAALSARKRARVAALLRQLDATGPLPSRAAPRPARPSLPFERERRRGPRVRVAMQALALDETRQFARDILFGTELSLGGMRIEPHPRLARGAELQLALQPPGGGAPFTLRAQVARDEGERGLVLRFQPLSREAQSGVERVLHAAAEIERTRRVPDAGERRIVMGTLLEEPATS